MLRIIAPHFVAGIEPMGRYAPILAYMCKWHEARIINYCAEMRWIVQRI